MPMARDYAPHAIRVNSIAPGSILFPGGSWERRRNADPEAIAEFVKRELPFGRFGSPDEVADVVVFVASARASWLTGACVPVDGGQSRGF
jgi:3-oxoacyl-[acyl-carrier protein] reductase